MRTPQALDHNRLSAGVGPGARDLFEMTRRTCDHNRLLAGVGPDVGDRLVMTRRTFDHNRPSAGVGPGACDRFMLTRETFDHNRPSAGVGTAACGYGCFDYREWQVPFGTGPRKRVRLGPHALKNAEIMGLTSAQLRSEEPERKLGKRTNVWSDPV